MPFKSEAQRRKFGELVKQGKMSQETFNEWNSETPKNIPERVGAPKKVKIRSTDDIREIGRQRAKRKK